MQTYLSNGIFGLFSLGYLVYFGTTLCLQIQVQLYFHSEREREREREMERERERERDTRGQREG